MNQFLEGDVLLEFRVVSELHCWDHCIRYNYCKAYNYHQTSDPSLENCQLLKSDIGLLKAREGHTYYVISEQNKDSQVREWSLFVTGGEGSEGFFWFSGGTEWGSVVANRAYRETRPIFIATEP